MKLTALKSYLIIALMTVLMTGGAASAQTAAQNNPSAAQSAPSADMENVEMRARRIGRQLRCVVCQNQSIEDSDATLAADMRKLVRAQIASGKSDEQVIAYMRERYGDFVLLEPPVQANTYALWAAPFALLLLGLLMYLRLAKRPGPDDVI